MSRVGLARALAGLALLLGVLAAAVALLAGPVYRMEWLALPDALMGMRVAAWGGIAALTCAVLALLAGLGSRAGSGRKALAALVLGVVVAGPLLFMFWKVQHVPRIHDVSTDLADPPVYVDVLPLRAKARNSVSWDLAAGALQSKGYPDLAPLVLTEPPAQAYARAERAARTMGWDIVAAVPKDGRIEATATSLLFAFKDDVVVRVRAQGAGSVIDVRSLSRVGGSDFGVNAARVRDYLGKVAATPAS